MANRSLNLPGGYSVELYGDTEQIIREIWQENCYHTLSGLKPGDVVVDLGANQGIFSLLAAQKGARVFAIEPDARNFEVLQRNISRNDLSEQIVPLNFAIGQTSGEIEIFIPERNGETLTGLITTTPSVQENYAGLSLSHLRRETVPCRRFGELLTLVPAGAIKFLKIDCEGAELDILNSGTKSDFARIENLAMETHWGYSEKSLYQRVRALDFRVTHYQKIEGFYSTGYLFAGRDATDAMEEYRRPVARIHIDSPATPDGSGRASAHDSFPTSAPATALRYEWRLDGAVLAGSEEAEVEIPASAPGNHRLELVAIDGERSDRDEAHFWCFSQQYGVAKEATAVEAVSTLQHEWVEGQRDFVFSHRLFPLGWGQNYFYIDVIERSRDSATAEPAAVIFDQREYPLRDGQRKVELPFFPRREDMKFSIRSSTRSRFTIECYVTERPIHMPSETQWLRGEQPRKLEYFGQPYACDLATGAKFISNLAGIADWTPRRIKVGVESAPGFCSRGGTAGKRVPCGKRGAAARLVHRAVHFTGVVSQRAQFGVLRCRQAFVRVRLVAGGGR